MSFGFLTLGTRLLLLCNSKDTRFEGAISEVIMGVMVMDFCLLEGYLLDG